MMLTGQNHQPRPGRTAMSTETNLEAGVWERLTDKLSAFSEGVVGMLGRLFGSSNERIVKSLGYVRPRGSEEHAIIPNSLLAQVNAWEEHMHGLSDDDIKALTPKFKERLAAGETLDDLLPE